MNKSLVFCDIVIGDNRADGRVTPVDVYHSLPPANLNQAEVSLHEEPRRFGSPLRVPQEVGNLAWILPVVRNRLWPVLIWQFPHAVNLEPGNNKHRACRLFAEDSHLLTTLRI